MATDWAPHEGELTHLTLTPGDDRTACGERITHRNPDAYPVVHVRAFPNHVRGHGAIACTPCALVALDNGGTP